MKKLCSLFLTFLKIGAFTFGGGYAMIALLENEFITRRHWMTQEEFLDMAAIAESTPRTGGREQRHLPWLPASAVCPGRSYQRSRSVFRRL